jgi:hypothetical protein
MAYAPVRSCNASLHEGMTDSSYKKFAQDRGGFVEGITAAVRSDMSGLWHGFNERQHKALPDGTVSVATPDFAHISPLDMENV